jgi:hypothetical protein
VNSASYCEFLLKLWDAIFWKCPGQQAREVLLHHHNASPHTPPATQERIQNYSGNFLNICLTAQTWPLVTPSVWSTKNHLGGKCYTDDKEAGRGVWKWLRQ